MNYLFASSVNVFIFTVHKRVKRKRTSYVLLKILDDILVNINHLFKI